MRVSSNDRIPAATQLAVHDLTGNGSGLILPVTSFAGQGTLALSLYDGTDPTDVTQFLTSIDTPGDARAVAIASGIAYVADASGGLAVVNDLAFDNQGQPPTVNISSAADLDPVAEGIQIVEASSVPIRVNVTDDVQVRNVQLLVNGEVVRNDVSFPFDFSPIVPAITPESNVATIQVLATDTGGNSTLSDPLVVELVPDTFAPTIVSTTPVDGSRRGQGFRTVRVEFSEPLDESTLTAENIQLIGPLGQILLPIDSQVRSNGRLVQFAFESSEPGSHELIIDTAAVTDRAAWPDEPAALSSPSSMLLGRIFGQGTRPIISDLHFTARPPSQCSAKVRRLDLRRRRLDARCNDGSES